MNHLDSRVRDRQLALDLDELAGRHAPPDRLAAILRRVADQPATLAEGGGRSSLRVRLVVAALCVLGLGVTFAVAALRSPAPQEDAGRSTVAGNPTPPVDHPRGTSAADLAAMRSAERMLEAERTLQQRLRDGRLPGVDRHLRFEELTGWRYEKGLDGMPDPVRALDGTRVSMIGFMLPIDEVRDIRHFLLVQSLWSCCYGTPPEVHGLVRVELPQDRPIDYSFDPLLVTGTFRVSATVEDGYVVDVFQLHADTAVPLR